MPAARSCSMSSWACGTRSRPSQNAVRGEGRPGRDRVEDPLEGLPGQVGGGAEAARQAHALRQVLVPGRSPAPSADWTGCRRSRPCRARAPRARYRAGPASQARSRAASTPSGYSSRTAGATSPVSSRGWPAPCSFSKARRPARRVADSTVAPRHVASAAARPAGEVPPRISTHWPGFRSRPVASEPQAVCTISGRPPGTSQGNSVPTDDLRQRHRRVLGIAAVVGAPPVPRHGDDLLPGSQPAAGRGRVHGAGGLDTRHPGKADAHAQTQPELQLRAVQAGRLDADAHPAVPLGRERKRGQPQVVHGAGGREPDGAHSGWRRRHRLPSSRGRRVGRRWSTRGRCGSIPNPGPQPRQINLGNATYRWESHEPVMLGSAAHWELSARPALTLRDEAWPAERLSGPLPFSSIWRKRQVCVNSSEKASSLMRTYKRSSCPVPLDLGHRQAADLGWLSLSGFAQGLVRFVETEAISPALTTQLRIQARSRHARGGRKSVSLDVGAAATLTASGPAQAGRCTCWPERSWPLIAARSTGEFVRPRSGGHCSSCAAAAACCRGCHARAPPATACLRLADARGAAKNGARTGK